MESPIFLSFQYIEPISCGLIKRWNHRYSSAFAVSCCFVVVGLKDGITDIAGLKAKRTIGVVVGLKDGITDIRSKVNKPIVHVVVGLKDGITDIDRKTVTIRIKVVVGLKDGITDIGRILKD